MTKAISSGEKVRCVRNRNHVLNMDFVVKHFCSTSNWFFNAALVVFRKIRFEMECQMFLEMLELHLLRVLSRYKKPTKCLLKISSKPEIKQKCC